MQVGRDPLEVRGTSGHRPTNQLRPTRPQDSEFRARGVRPAGAARSVD